LAGRKEKETPSHVGTHSYKKENEKRKSERKEERKKERKERKVKRKRLFSLSAHHCCFEEFFDKRLLLIFVMFYQFSVF
jgi:hypothetical protein